MKNSRQGLLRLASKSQLMAIDIKYGDERVRFNLFKELAIKESSINSDITDQPQVYSFLLMLHKRLIAREEELEMEKKSAWSKIYLKYKDEKDPSTGRPHSDDRCKAKADSSKLFINATKAYILAKQQRGTIESCVKSFEQRKDMVQTLSANLRKEN